jgi:AraC-like DNA-binding protein
LHPDEQFEAWRDLYADVFAISLVDTSSSAFEAEHRAYAFGTLTLTRASMPSAVQRKWAHFAQPRREDWMMVVVPSKRHRPVQFRSLTTPFEGRGGDGEVLTLFIPREGSGRARRIFDSSPHEMSYSGLAALAADYVIGLERFLSTAPSEKLPEIAQASYDLLAALLAPNAEHIERAERPLNDLLVHRAAIEIRKNLADASFGPAQLGRATGMSRSRLYRILEPHGGVARFIQQERLAQAYRQLTETPEKPINQIVYDTGFVDHSSFSRAFKRTYGCTPSDLKYSVEAKALPTTES